MKDGKNFEKYLGQTPKDKYNKKLLLEKGNISPLEFDNMSPAEKTRLLFRLDHKLIKENLDLCFKLVRETQSWPDPSNPASTPMKWLTRSLKDKISNYLKSEKFPGIKRLEYYTAIKSGQIENENMNLNLTHLDMKGIDAFFDVILEESGVGIEKEIKYISLPFDLTGNVKEYKGDIYIMKVDMASFDNDFSDLKRQVQEGKPLTKDQEVGFVKKYLSIHTEGLFNNFIKQYSLGNILTR